MKNIAKSFWMPDKLWEKFLEKCRNEKISGSRKVRELMETWVGLKRIKVVKDKYEEVEPVEDFHPKLDEEDVQENQNKDSTEVREDRAQSREDNSIANTFYPNL